MPLTNGFRKKTTHWTNAVEQLAQVARTQPQVAYAGLQKSLQQEWQFVQRVRQDIGNDFHNVQKAIAADFLPSLFGDNIMDDDPRIRLATLPVKAAGLALPNPVESADPNYLSSLEACSHLCEAILGNIVFSPADHRTTISETRSDNMEIQRGENAATLADIVAAIPCDDRRTIMRGKDTGQWLSVLPSQVNGTELSADEFRDNVMLRYAREPVHLPTHCDGCHKKFSVRHALECKKGGLVISRHDEVRDELAALAVQAYKPSSVRDEPKIYPSRPEDNTPATAQHASQVSRNLRKTRNEDRGDLLIRGLWARSTDCIIDVRMTDIDCPSNRSRKPESVLAAHEREKKKKYLQPCLEQRRHFTPFVTSTDGLIGEEAKTLLKKLASDLAEKSGKQYSQVCGYVRARISIAIVRATHRCLRGSRIPTGQMSNRRTLWEDSAGMSLFRH